jgi:2-keto-3-deoxy-6-phosphogluconate aldolase
VIGLVKRFAKDESGATAIEYGLIAAGVSVAIITVVNKPWVPAKEHIRKDYFAAGHRWQVGAGTFLRTHLSRPFDDHGAAEITAW